MGVNRIGIGEPMSRREREELCDRLLCAARDWGRNRGQRGRCAECMADTATEEIFDWWLNYWWVHGRNAREQLASLAYSEAAALGFDFEDA